jgi:predicted component of type VI protein secretion system
MSIVPDDYFKSQKTDIYLIHNMIRLRKNINTFIGGLYDDVIKYNDYTAVKDFIDISSYILFPERYKKKNKGVSFSKSFYLATCAFEECDEFKVKHFDKLDELKPCFKKLFYDLENFSNSDSKQRLIKFLLSLDDQLEEEIKLELK